MGYGIILADIIPAPVRCPTKEDIILGEPCARPAGKAHVGTTWYNIRRETCRNDMI